MNPHRLLILITLAAVAWVALVGCHGKGANTAKGIHDDTAIVGQHIEAAKTDVLKADEKVAAVAKAPDTTKASAATLNSARDDLSNARGNLIDAAEPLPAINKAADSLLDQLNAAKDEQRKHDERQMAFIFGLAVAVAVFFAVERMFPVTYLIALIPAVLAGGMAVLIFGTVYAWVVGALVWVLRAVVIGGAVALGLYVYKRVKAGGWAGLIKNTGAELGKVPAALHPDTAAVIEEFRRYLAPFQQVIHSGNFVPAFQAAPIVGGSGAPTTVNL